MLFALWFGGREMLQGLPAAVAAIHGMGLVGQAHAPKDTSDYLFLLGGLAATVAATTVVTRTAQRALRDV